MTTLPEARERAQNEGTTQITRFRETLAAVIKWTGAIVIALGLSVVAWRYLNSDAVTDDDYVADDYETDGDYVTEDDLACTKPWHPKPISGNPNRPTQINPGGDCVWAVEIPDGYCIMGRRADRVADDRPYGPYCNIEGVEHIETEDDIEWVWSVDQFGRPAEPIINAELRLTPDP